MMTRFYFNIDAVEAGCTVDSCRVVFQHWLLQALKSIDAADQLILELEVFFFRTAS